MALLRAWSEGDEGALERLVPLVEAELGRLARGYMAHERRSLDRALPEVLAAGDPRKGRVVEMRFFGGLSVEEIAEVRHVSPDTVKRDWRLAKLWLLRELEGDTR